MDRRQARGLQEHGDERSGMETGVQRRSGAGHAPTVMETTGLNKNELKAGGQRFS